MYVVLIYNNLMPPFHVPFLLMSWLFISPFSGKEACQSPVTIDIIIWHVCVYVTYRHNGLNYFLTVNHIFCEVGACFFMRYLYRLQE